MILVILVMTLATPATTTVTAEAMITATTTPILVIRQAITTMVTADTVMVPHSPTVIIPVLIVIPIAVIPMAITDRLSSVVTIHPRRSPITTATIRGIGEGIMDTAEVGCIGKSLASAKCGVF